MDRAREPRIGTPFHCWASPTVTFISSGFISRDFDALSSLDHENPLPPANLMKDTMAVKIIWGDDDASPAP